MERGEIVQGYAEEVAPRRCQVRLMLLFNCSCSARAHAGQIHHRETRASARFSFLLLFDAFFVFFGGRERVMPLLPEISMRFRSEKHEKEKQTSRLRVVNRLVTIICII